MNTKNYFKNAGSFQAGQLDKRRNHKGQMNAEAVALGALLKKYLTDKGSKTHNGWPFGAAKQREQWRKPWQPGYGMKQLTAIFNL